MGLEKGFLRRTGLAATATGALLLAALPGAEPAFAGDGNMFSSITNFLKTPFGGGPKPDHNDNGAIDYRPRPALVVPPNYDLPPPQQHVDRGPNWPRDPDAAAMRRAKADSRQLAPRSDDETAVADTATADPAPANQPAPAGQPAPALDPGYKRISLQDLGGCTSFMGMPLCLTTPWSASHHGGSNNDVRVNGTPTRKYLVDPPVSYLEPASPTQSADDTAREPDEKVSRVSPDKIPSRR